eukprot:CAMPEP_0196589264 /NCGR_PEP_ID=MMETSP1081-20130531/63143_1 /TAXON_ID=36882 /ORGANISM="Pyramimonas amylifera, Strain CCMP720" /LENGTH=207 /DNA_ID=CAMNT_0041912019 /DNA_START=60 /DNA_END=683 /DNA_ORIENTATION=-
MTKLSGLGGEGEEESYWKAHGDALAGQVERHQANINQLTSLAASLDQHTRATEESILSLRKKVNGDQGYLPSAEVKSCMKLFPPTPAPRWAPSPSPSTSSSHSSPPLPRTLNSAFDSLSSPCHIQSQIFNESPLSQAQTPSIPQPKTATQDESPLIQAQTPSISQPKTATQASLMASPMTAFAQWDNADMFLTTDKLSAEEEAYLIY